MPIIPINVGGIGEPTQVTVDTPGTYDVGINLLAATPAVTFQGPGAFTVNTLANVLSGATVAAVGGANLTLNNVTSVLGALNVTVDGTSFVTVGTGIAAASAINAQFSGSGGTFNFLPGGLSVLTTPPNVFGFAAGDHLEFGGASTAGDQITYTPNLGNTGGTLTLETGGGVAIGSVELVGVYSINNFVLGADGIDFACFLRGTRLLTSRGDVPVEMLRAGDLVATVENGFVPVTAVRGRTFAAGASAGDKVRPVRIGAGALGRGLPRRDLLVSPDHGLFLDGALVPARLLVNGRSITQPECRIAIEYVHVEVEPHDLLIAEGVATESYLDIGNRQHFGRPGVVSLAGAAEPKSWDDACAPLLLAGPRLSALRSRFLDIALQLDEKPALQLVA